MQRLVSTPARRSAGRFAAVALAGVSWLTACGRTTDVTAPVAAASPFAAVPTPATGALDVAGLGLAAVGAACTAPTIAAVRTAGDQFQRLGGLAMLGMTTSTTGVPMYDIGTPDPAATTSPVDIDDAGTVVANVIVGTTSTAYTWTEGGGFVPIPALAGAISMIATDINDAGVVVGFASVGGGAFRSWRYAGGATTEITGPANLQVRAINDAGLMTGSAGTGSAAVAVRWTGATWETLGGGSPASGWGINGAGDVAGWVGAGAAQRAYLWAAGSTAGQNLGLPIGSSASRGYALNDAGAVVGSATVAGQVRAIYWAPGGAAGAEITGTGFAPPSIALDISNNGLVTGYAVVSAGGSHAFAWTAPGGPMKDLGKDAASCSSFGFGINDRYKVVGYNAMTDAGQGQHLARWDLTPPNTPPAPTITAATAGTCSAAASITFTFTDVDGASDGPWTYVIDWGDGTTSAGTATTAGAAITATHAYATNGTFDVRVTVTDARGASATSAARSVVRDCNTPPVPKVTLAVNGTCTAASSLEFSFTDVDGSSDGPWSYSVSWGDGTAPTTGSAAAPGTISLTHGYLSNGPFTVTITVTDRRGAAGTTTTTLGRTCKSGVCTYTQGYWKNHEGKWPSGYSPKAHFMKSGPKSVTWSALFDTPPKSGDSYVQLAHQWMAAALSVASGAPMRSDVLAAFGDAKAWLYANTGADGSIPSSLKSTQASAWASKLDDYNNGKLGTSHCDDEGGKYDRDDDRYGGDKDDKYGGDKDDKKDGDKQDGGKKGQP